MRRGHAHKAGSRRGEAREQSMAALSWRSALLSLLVCFSAPFVLSQVVSKNNLLERDDCLVVERAYEEARASFAGHSYSTVRFVDSSLGNDTEDCLSGGESVPCKTINFAATGNVSAEVLSNVESLEIVLLPGEHRLTKLLYIVESTFVYVHGLDAATTTVKCTKFPNDKLINGTCVFDDLAFQTSSFVRISDLTFTECGLVSVGLFLFNTTEVLVEGCIFEGITGTAVHVPNIINGYFVDNIFRNNKGSLLDASFKENTCARTLRDLFFLSNSSSAGGMSIVISEETSRVLILRTAFEGNWARPNFLEETIPTRLQPLGRGGALSLRLLNSTNSSICIKESTFVGNAAEISSGAITSSVAVGTTDSGVTLKQCLFEDNWCERGGCAGGAMQFQTGVSAGTNYFHMKDTIFRNNSAGTGAAFSSISSHSLIYNFDNCTFEGSIAESDGSAVAILNAGPVTFTGNKLTCINCNFTGNRRFGELGNVPAIYAYRSHLHFLGTTTFTSNVGGGMQVVQGFVQMEGDMRFSRNLAFNGAGLKLINNAEFFVVAGAQITFDNNHASNFGGAIYAFLSYPLNDVSLNRRCFLQYWSPLGIDIPPSDWNVTITFDRNTAANGGDAIYSSDFDLCRFLGSANTTDFPYSPSIFNIPPGYPSPFTYIDRNGVRVNEGFEMGSLLATQPRVLQTTPLDYKVCLSELTGFELMIEDELLTETSAVIAVDGDLDLQPLASVNEGEFRFTVHGERIEGELRERCRNSTVVKTPTGSFCSERVNASVEFNVQGRSDVTAEATLEVVQCHPGYAYNKEADMCVCRNDEVFEFNRCDNANRHFYVLDNIWVYLGGNGSVLSLRTVTTTYLNCRREQSSLPGCLVEFDHLERQCAEGRIGLMCAACNASAGYGVTMDLKFCTPDCQPAGGAILFVFICVATIIGCVVVLYFNIGIPNELRGFFLYAQVIGLVYFYTTELNANERGTPFLDILVSLLGNSLPFPVCISKNITTTWMTVLGYVPPALAFITVLVFVISARYISRLAKRSALGGISLILLFVYKYITDVSFILFNCTDVPLPSGHTWVSRYSGDRCFEFPHVFWLVVALLLFCTVIAPIPIFIIVITTRRFNKAKHFADVFARGLHPKFGWYSGWDLLRRVYFVLVALWLPYVYISTRLLALLLFEVVMLVVHCLSKPYEKKWINVVEALILLDLFVATAAILQSFDRYITDGFIVLLVVLPYIYGVSMALYLVGRYCWINSLSDKWRERITVRLSPLITFHSKMRASWRSNLRTTKAKKKSPEPKVFGQQTSTFYVDTEGRELSANEMFEASSDYRSSYSQNELLQYRPELIVD